MNKKALGAGMWLAQMPSMLRPEVPAQWEEMGEGSRREEKGGGRLSESVYGPNTLRWKRQ